MNTSAKSDYESDHKDIPGNPSTSKTSTLKLNRRGNNEPLRVLNETQWNFWRENGYVVIKNAISNSFWPHCCALQDVVIGSSWGQNVVSCAKSSTSRYIL